MLPQGSCDELEERFESEARALERKCANKEDCSLLWSAYNCYALRSKSDDVTVLESIDKAMEKAGCDEVECEPPPTIECDDGRCDWAL